MLLASAGTSLCGNIATQECVTSGQRDPILNMPPYAAAVFAEDVCMTPSKPTEWAIPLNRKTPPTEDH